MKENKQKTLAIRNLLLEENIISKELASSASFARNNHIKLASTAAMISTGAVEAEDAIALNGLSYSSYKRLIQAAEVVLEYFEINEIDYKDTDFEILIEVRNSILKAEALPQKKITEAMFAKIEGKFHHDGEYSVFEKGASIKDLELLSRHINKRKRDDRSTSNNTNVSISNQNNVASGPVKIEITDPSYIKETIQHEQTRLIQETNSIVDDLERQLLSGDLDE